MFSDVNDVLSAAAVPRLKEYGIYGFIGKNSAR